MAAEEARFDWGAIARATGIIVGGTALIGVIVPLALTVLLKLGHTGRVSGNDIYRWGFWAVAWALTLWQGTTMLRRVHDAIIDDMIVTAVLSAVILFFVKLLLNLTLEPLNEQGALLPVVTAIDTGGALVLVVVAIISARVNRF